MFDKSLSIEYQIPCDRVHLKSLQALNDITITYGIIA